MMANHCYYFYRKYNVYDRSKEEGRIIKEWNQKKRKKKVQHELLCVEIRIEIEAKTCVRTRERLLENVGAIVYLISFVFSQDIL